MNAHNHAVLVVGYDSSNNYIIKNSNGITWGELGYMTIDHTSDCGLRIVNYQVYLFRLTYFLALAMSVLVLIS